MKKSVLAILTTTMLVTPSFAWAQDAADEDRGGLEEIIVTAQKREEGLSRVPISISAVSGESISETGTANLEQLSSSVPNLRITQTGIANRIVIRGVSSGDNKGFEQSAAMFVDGIYYGRDQLVRMPIVDVARVEVLRGPQPTLFGKNAIAGAISIINNKPSDDFGGSLTGSYEFNHKETQLTGIVNAPIGEMAAVRLVGYYRKQDGYIFNTTQNRDEPNVDTKFFRGTFSLGKDGPVTASLKIEHADFAVLGQARENFNPRGTYSASPFFTTSDGCWTRLVQDMSEMWMRPSIPGSISTKAPNEVRLRTLPLIRVPTGYLSGRITHGSCSVCFIPSEIFSSVSSTLSTTASMASPIDTIFEG